jgi:hypothetical protein
MDVTAFPYQGQTAVELGSIADSIWVQGFKMGETRSIQVSKPMNAPAPNLFDRFTRVQEFSFAAGRSFSGAAAVGDALQFLGSHPAQVPAIADLQFKSQGGEIWLCYCGITRVELIEKKSALVIFSYTVTGGTWSKTRLAAAV